jgi:hypothetical protein
MWALDESRRDDGISQWVLWFNEKCLSMWCTSIVWWEGVIMCIWEIVTKEHNKGCKHIARRKAACSSQLIGHNHPSWESRGPLFIHVDHGFKIFIHVDHDHEILHPCREEGSKLETEIEQMGWWFCKRNSCERGFSFFAYIHHTTFR